MNIPQTLTSTQLVRVRFGEVDSMDIVWHGNYLKYFEEGRDTFSREYEFNYIELAAQGFIMPVVDLQINYIKPLRYGDTALVQTTLVDCPAAKVIFDYRVYNAANKSLCCKGRTVQVFLNERRQLELTHPPYVQAWREQFLNSESLEIA